MDEILNQFMCLCCLNRWTIEYWINIALIYVLFEQVFFVDFGNREWTNERNVRHMQPEFLHLPFQAIECFLVDMEPLSKQTYYSALAKYAFGDNIFVF